MTWELSALPIRTVRSAQQHITGRWKGNMAPGDSRGSRGLWRRKKATSGSKPKRSRPPSYSTIFSFSPTSLISWGSTQDQLSEEEKPWAWLTDGSASYKSWHPQASSGTPQSHLDQLWRAVVKGDLAGEQSSKQCNFKIFSPSLTVSSHSLRCANSD